MTKVSINNDALGITASNSLAARSVISAPSSVSTEVSTEPSADLVTRWLEKLLRHFGISELDASSDRRLAELIEQCGMILDSMLLDELRRRIVRLAGARLDRAFVAMAPEVIDEEDADAIFLTVAGRQLKGLRYQSEVYRLTQSFKSTHRLQAFCLAQTLSEQAIPYIITQSKDCFAVWVNIRALPCGHYRDHLPSFNNSSNFGH